MSLEIDSVAQTTTSISTTEAIFTISNVSTQAFANNKLFFEVGLPKNHSLVEASLAITPQFVSISPSSGSVGGTVITAIVPGATKTSTDLDIKKVDGDSICESVTVISYGVVECMTKAEVIDAATQLKVTQDGTDYDCVNSDLTLCQYE